MKYNICFTAVSAEIFEYIHNFFPEKQSKYFNSYSECNIWATNTLFRKKQALKYVTYFVRNSH